LGASYEDLEAGPKWSALKTMVMAFGVMTVYLAVLAIMFSLLEPQGVGWTVATAGSGLTIGTAAFLLVRWLGREGATRLLAKNEVGE
jgi:hypothetical protein